MKLVNYPKPVNACNITLVLNKACRALEFIKDLVLERFVSKEHRIELYCKNNLWVLKYIKDRVVHNYAV